MGLRGLLFAPELLTPIAMNWLEALRTQSAIFTVFTIHYRASLLIF